MRDNGKKIFNFQDLVAWQKAHQLMVDVYQFVDSLPREEKFNRTVQLKRAASSLPANIAEGFGRYHYQENAQFCRQARGSLDEVKNHIIAAKDLAQAPTEECLRLLAQCDEARAILNGYIRATLARKRDL